MKRVTSYTLGWRGITLLVALAATAIFASIASGGASRSAATTGDIWSVQGNAQVDISNLQGVTLGTVTLPKGNYLLMGKVALKDALQDDYFDCRIYDQNGNVDYSEGRAAQFDTVSLPLQAVVKPSATTTYNLRCNGSHAGSRAYYWHMTALKVGTVN